MELNQSNPRNSGLKAAIVVLALLLMGSLAYMYKLNLMGDEILTKRIMLLFISKFNLNISPICHFGTHIRPNVYPICRFWIHIVTRGLIL